MSDSGVVILFDSSRHSHLTPYLAAIHASCITHDRTIATFLPPLSHEKLLSWWKERISETTNGTRLIFLLLSHSDVSDPPKGPELMGVVMLTMSPAETGSFRANVDKLLVHKNFRGRGGAKALMKALETEAESRGRKLLVRSYPYQPNSCFCSIKLTIADA